MGNAIYQFVVTLVGALFLLIFLNGVYQMIRRHMAPPQSAPAVVKLKLGRRFTVRTGRRGARNQPSFTVQFQAGEELLTLACPLPIFRELEEGQRGALTWKADRVLAFERETAAVKSEES